MRKRKCVKNRMVYDALLLQLNFVVLFCYVVFWFLRLVLLKVAAGVYLHLSRLELGARVVEALGLVAEPLLGHAGSCVDTAHLLRQQRLGALLSLLLLLLCELLLQGDLFLLGGVGTLLGLLLLTLAALFGFGLVRRGICSLQRALLLNSTGGLLGPDVVFVDLDALLLGVFVVRVVLIGVVVGIGVQALASIQLVVVLAVEVVILLSTHNTLLALGVVGVDQAAHLVDTLGCVPDKGVAVLHALSRRELSVIVAVRNSEGGHMGGALLADAVAVNRQKDARVEAIEHVLGLDVLDAFDLLLAHRKGGAVNDVMSDALVLGTGGDGSTEAAGDERDLLGDSLARDVENKAAEEALGRLVVLCRRIVVEGHTERRVLIVTGSESRAGVLLELE
eukprot:PhM_4_TR2618/c0_g1_i1/m.16767